MHSEARIFPVPAIARRDGYSDHPRDRSILEPVFGVASFIAWPLPPASASPQQPHASPRVLLVDDCPIQLLLGCVLLARWQIVPEIANDGLEAVLLAREQEFDLLLMDVEMRVMDGLTATRRIRQHEKQSKRGKRVPVVAYTGSEAALSEHTWRECGMDAVLGKPSPEPIMELCLKRWCPDMFKVQRGPLL